MQKSSKGPIVLSLLIITVGIGWLLTTLSVAPGINWVLTLSLGMIGVLAFVVSGGIDKVSVIVGPFFLVGSVLSLLRQAKLMTIDIEIPICVILIGVLMLLAQLRSVPLPKWFIPLKESEE